MAKKYNLGNVGGISKTILYDTDITSAGSYPLNSSVDNFKMIIVEAYYAHEDGKKYHQGTAICTPLKYAKAHMVTHGDSSMSCCSMFHFSKDGGSIIADYVYGEIITKIYGIN